MLDCFGHLAIVAQCLCQSIFRIGKAGADGECAVVMGDRVVHLPGCKQRVGQIGVNCGDTFVDRERPPIMADGACGIIPPHAQRRKVVDGVNEIRVDLQGGLEGIHRFIELAGIGKRGSKMREHGCIFGHQGGGACQIRDGLLVTPLLECNNAEKMVGVGMIGILRQDGFTSSRGAGNVSASVMLGRLGHDLRMRIVDEAPFRGAGVLQLLLTSSGRSVHGSLLFLRNPTNALSGCLAYNTVWPNRIARCGNRPAPHFRANQK